MKSTFLYIFMLCVFTTYSQVLDEEIGFRFVKAEYLLKTERFEDAIKELNEIIKQSPAFKNALILRGETKYKLASFKSAKADALESINLAGVTGKAASILGKAEFAMNNIDAAFTSINSAIILGEKEMKLYELRAEIYEMRNQKLSACSDWQAAAALGSNKGAVNAKRSCGIQTEVPVSTEESTNTTDQPESSNKQTENSNSGSTTTDTTVPTTIESNGTTTTPTSDSTVSVPPVIEEMPEEDNTVNEVVVDEDLTLQIFGSSLGKRKLMEKPNILILTENDGVVVVEVCVSKEGKVLSADYVSSKSTLVQSSLVSLAIRKAKELWFEPSKYSKQCGFINFVIKGSK
jgi:tetratricopeptide (TPR) repeat protein